MKYILILLLLPTVLNAQVYTEEQWVSLYLRDCGNLTEEYACKQNLEKQLGLMYAYGDFITRELKSAGLSPRFAFIPLVESGYKEKAISEDGALGLWQLMPYHIKESKTREVEFFGRKIEIVPTDEKVTQYGLNAVLNTEVAIDHLLMLYKSFRYENGDTERYIIMAYNGGRTMMNNHIYKSGKIPDESLNYYNRYMAVHHIVKHMRLYRIKPMTHEKIPLWVRIKDLVGIQYDEERNARDKLISSILG